MPSAGGDGAATEPLTESGATVRRRCGTGEHGTPQRSPLTESGATGDDGAHAPARRGRNGARSRRAGRPVNRRAYAAVACRNGARSRRAGRQCPVGPASDACAARSPLTESGATQGYSSRGNEGPQRSPLTESGATPKLVDDCRTPLPQRSPLTESGATPIEVLPTSGPVSGRNGARSRRAGRPGPPAAARWAWTPQRSPLTESGAT